MVYYFIFNGNYHQLAYTDKGNYHLLTYTDNFNYHLLTDTDTGNYDLVTDTDNVLLYYDSARNLLMHYNKRVILWHCRHTRYLRTHKCAKKSGVAMRQKTLPCVIHCWQPMREPVASSRAHAA